LILTRCGVSPQDAQHKAEATHNAQTHKAEAAVKDAQRKADEKKH
jgi:hypothetical protein